MSIGTEGLDGREQLYDKQGTNFRVKDVEMIANTF